VISNTALILLNFVAIINIVIICFYLCFRKNNILPNYILACIFLIPGLYFIDNILILSGFIYKVYYFFFIVQILASLFPILVYYYIHLLLTDNKHFHKVLITGSAVLLLYIIYLTIDFYNLSGTDKTAYITSLNSENYPTSMLLYTVFFYAWQIVYFILILIQIKKHRLKAEGSFSNFESIKLDFVKQFMALLGILNFGLIVFYIVLPLAIVDYGILPTFVTIIFIFIIYCTVKHNVVFSKESYQDLVQENTELTDFSVPQETADLNTTIKNELDERVKLIGTRIEDILFAQKVHHNPDLKLAFLAEKLNEPAYIVSQALNKYFNKTFYELINELRIKEAENRLKSFNSKKETIEGLAFDVGFNSRAAFYRAFKKHTGKTPTEFIKH
jgi:AraC-like DNA-binding protein